MPPILCTLASLHKTFNCKQTSQIHHPQNIPSGLLPLGPRLHPLLSLLQYCPVFGGLPDFGSSARLPSSVPQNRGPHHCALHTLSDFLKDSNRIGPQRTLILTHPPQDNDEINPTARAPRASPLFSSSVPRKGMLWASLFSSSV